jgi:hypothetical protein
MQAMAQVVIPVACCLVVLSFSGEDCGAAGIEVQRIGIPLNSRFYHLITSALAPYQESG